MCNCTCQESFSGPGWSMKQHSLWGVYPDFLEQVRPFQGKFYCFLNFSYLLLKTPDIAVTFHGGFYNLHAIDL